MPGAKIAPPPPRGCLWIDAAADYVGQAVTTLYKWGQQGRGPQGFKAGRRWAYRVTDLDAYLDDLVGAARAPRPEMRPPEPRRLKTTRAA